MDYPNMSYCACENTSLALAQIETMMSDYATVEDFMSDLSESELRGFRRILASMAEILGNAEHEGLI